MRVRSVCVYKYGTSRLAWWEELAAARFLWSVQRSRSPFLLIQTVSRRRSRNLDFTVTRLGDRGLHWLPVNGRYCVACSAEDSTAV